MRINKIYWNVNVINYFHLWGELWKSLISKSSRIGELNSKEISRNKSVGEITITLNNTQFSENQIRLKNNKLFGN